MSETGAVTLTEFLLARIAEDESAAQRWYGSGTVSGRSDNFWLAEIEAKRRIIAWHDGRDDCCDERYGPFEVDVDSTLSAGTDAFGGLTLRRPIGSQRFIGCVTLMHLATPYADQPDYRDEWRP